MNRILLLITTFLLAGELDAQMVSLDDARSKAVALRQSAGRRVRAVAEMPLPELVYTQQASGNTLYYVFNYPNGGFSIIGGDENAREVLGYSETGAFSLDSIPPGLKYMLKSYDCQILDAIEHPAVAESSSARRRVAAQPKASIACLMTTKWNQRKPYNCMIPKYTTGLEFVTGCNATAIAQVMKFYNYPKVGVGEYSYTINYIEAETDEVNPVTFQADFGSTTYDWDNMLDVYGASYTTAQAQAVGTLIYHVGVGLETSYNGNASASNSLGAGLCLPTYFKYSKSVTHENRLYYSDEEWENMVYHELSAGHPVLYGGSSSAGGHAFVVHGYDASKDAFAVNWGWGGSYDGYFPLTGTDALKPKGSGIGGGGDDAAYTKDQHCFIGMVPDPSGRSTYVMQIGIDGELSFSDGTVTKDVNRNTDVDNTFSLSKIVFRNIGISNSTFYYGVMLEETTNGSLHLFSANRPVTLQTSTRTGRNYSLSFSTSGLPFGTYNIYPVACEGKSSADPSDWVRMYVPAGYTYPQMTIIGGADAPLADLVFKISDTQVEVGKTLSITAPKAYSGHITYTSNNPDVLSVGQDGVVKALSQGSAEVSVTGTSDGVYKAATMKFKIDVYNKFKGEPYFAISGQEVIVGNKLTISRNKDCDGKVTFSTSDPSVAKVDANGAVTGVSEGWAYITAKSSYTDNYYSLSKLFKVHVVPNPSHLPSGLVFTYAPYIDNGNRATATNAKIHFILMNNSSQALSSADVYYEADFGRFIMQGSVVVSPFRANSTENMDIDLKGCLSGLTDGKVCKVSFYSDKNRKVPMNYPSLSFTYYSALPALVGDFNGDDIVNMEDLDMLKQSLLRQSVPSTQITDFNGDGRLSVKDITDFVDKLK